jgi:O-antigen biosynthesis protein
MLDPSLRAARGTGYEGTRPDIQAVVPREARRLLDVGCGGGGLGAVLRDRQPVHVVGVEPVAEYAKEARGRLDVVMETSIEDYSAGDPPVELYDCIVFADVLEHLPEPRAVLASCLRFAAPGATIIVSVPNVLYWPEFRRILAGDWPAEDAGTFDRTHLRWFTPRTARALLADLGLRDVETKETLWALRRRDKLISALLRRMGLRRFTIPQVVAVGRVTHDPP